jgi:desulfoferrodoxin FeS4 iron-binding domain
VEKKYYRCSICGNLVDAMVIGGGKLVCCGKEMSLLSANTTDGAREKHVPDYTLAGNILTVQVGSTAHPMTPEHFIQWIAVQQGNVTQWAKLLPTDAPTAVFCIDPAEKFVLYEHCNLHGLWKKE